MISDEEMRKRFEESLRDDGFIGVGVMSIVAVEAAYNESADWLDQLLTYIDANLSYLREYLADNLPQIRVVQPEGTYLVWLDCRALELDSAGLRHLMLDEARVYLDEGAHFGSEGEGFMRINIACPRSILVEALDRIKGAVANHLSR
jgi:cysteine-S-conjugate beta-lyase